MPEPLEGQPLDRPFAWALIQLDGADTVLAARGGRRIAGPDVDRNPRARAVGDRNGSARSPTSSASTDLRRGRGCRPVEADDGHDGHHAGEPALPARGVARRRAVPARRSPKGGCSAALPGLPRRSTSRRAGLPHRRCADDRRGRAARPAARSRRSASSTCRSSASGSPRRTSPPTCCWTVPTSRSCTWCSAATPARCGWACGSRPSWKPREEWGPTMREHRPLQAVRRTGRAVRLLLPAPVRRRMRDDRGRRLRADALRARDRRHHQRRRDAGADLPRGARRARTHQDRHRLLVLRLVGLPGRAGVLVRRRRSTRSVRSRRSTSRTSRWTRRGRSTRPG